MNQVNALQSTIADLKEIVQRNPGPQTEAMQLVGQLESIIADIEKKTRKPGVVVVPGPAVIQTVPVV